MKDEIHTIFNIVSQFTFDKIPVWSTGTMDVTYYVCLGSLWNKEKKVFIFVTEGLETQVRCAIYQRNLAGYSLWGHKKIKHNLVTKQHHHQK